MSPAIYLACSPVLVPCQARCTSGPPSIRRRWFYEPRPASRPAWRRHCVMGCASALTRPWSGRPAPLSRKGSGITSSAYDRRIVNQRLTEHESAGGSPSRPLVPAAAESGCRPSAFRPRRRTRFRDRRDRKALALDPADGGPGSAAAPRGGPSARPRRQAPRRSRSQDTSRADTRPPAASRTAHVDRHPGPAAPSPPGSCRWNRTCWTFYPSTRLCAASSPAPAVSRSGMTRLDRGGACGAGWPSPDTSVRGEFGAGPAHA